MRGLVGVTQLLDDHQRGTPAHQMNEAIDHVKLRFWILWIESPNTLLCLRLTLIVRRP